MQNINDEDDEFLINKSKIDRRKTFKNSTLTVNSIDDIAEDLDKNDESREIMVRSVTPTIDEEALKSFDMKSQKIVALISSQEQGSIDLAQESKPVRDVLKANYGVSYNERLEDGGGTNMKILGGSYYASPGRNMRKDELEQKQKREKASIVQDYQKSRLGDVASAVSAAEKHQ